MKEHRHPHPHRDPRQPRHNSRPGTNPPVFAWKPLEGHPSYRLRVARDAAFADPCLDAGGLADSVHLPDRAFAPGRYFWKWSASAAESEVFAFEVPSDAPQLMRSHDSQGAIQNAFEDERLVYLRGNADAAYADRALRCRRHLLFLRHHACFILIDEFVARPDVASALQWNIHSWAAFEVDHDARTFALEREGSALKGHLMYHKNAFFSLSEGWDPPTMKEKDDSRWFPQYHLRFTTSGLAPRRNLGVVLCPGHAALTPAQVLTERSGEAEVARIGDDLVLVNQADAMEYRDIRTDALALLIVQGQRYEIQDEGIQGG